MAKKILNVFRYHGHHNERAKTQAMMVSHFSGVECATDMLGNPQAYFKLPDKSNQRVLGVPRSEAELIEHKPTLMLEHKAQ